MNRNELAQVNAGKNFSIANVTYVHVEAIERVQTNFSNIADWCQKIACLQVEAVKNSIEGFWWRWLV